MADLTVTMTTTRCRPLSQECIEARIVFRVAQLRELAAWTACEYWRQRKAVIRMVAPGEIDIPPDHRAFRQER